MLNKSSQSQLMVYCIIPFIVNIHNRQIYGARKQKSDYLGLGWARMELGKWEELMMGVKFFFWEGENVLKMILLMIVQFSDYFNNH